MSTTMYWRKVYPKSRKDLSTSMKFKLAPRFLDHDGSLSSEPVVLNTEGDLEFLEGLRCGLNNEEDRKKIEELANAVVDSTNGNFHVELWTA